MERRSVVLPSDADGRSACSVRAVEPGRSADRAGRPADDRVRDLGGAQLPSGFRRRGLVGVASRYRGLRRPPRCSVLHRRDRVVRSRARRTGGRRAAGDRRPPPRRPVLRHLPQSRAPTPPRRMGQLTGLSGIVDRAEVGHDTAMRHHPGDRHGLLHDEHRGRAGAGGPVAACRVRSRLPGGLDTDQSPAHIHDRHARHRSTSRRAAVLEPRRLSATVSSPARPSDDDRPSDRFVSANTTSAVVFADTDDGCGQPPAVVAGAASAAAVVPGASSAAAVVPGASSAAAVVPGASSAAAVVAGGPAASAMLSAL